MAKALILTFTASGPYYPSERQAQAAFDNKEDREAHQSGLSTELFDRRAGSLASITAKELEKIGFVHEVVDFSQSGVPAMDRVEFQRSEFVRRVDTLANASTHLLWIVPVWKHQVAVSARAMLPLFRPECLHGKVSALLFVLRGSAHSGAGRSLMLDLMLQSHCWLLPRIVEAVHSDFQEEKLLSESITNQISTMIHELVVS